MSFEKVKILVFKKVEEAFVKLHYTSLKTENAVFDQRSKESCKCFESGDNAEADEEAVCESLQGCSLSNRGGRRGGKVPKCRQNTRPRLPG